MKSAATRALVLALLLATIVFGHLACGGGGNSSPTAPIAPGMTPGMPAATPTPMATPHY